MKIKMKNTTFDDLRFYSEVLGHIITFLLAISEIIGFKYGVELSAIAAAFNIMTGSILQSIRYHYEEDMEDEI